MFPTLLQVAVGGALGAVARFLAGGMALRLAGPGFPWGTFGINVSGSFLMGVLVVLLDRTGLTRLAPFFLTGILGGFTTFSAYSLDTVRLAEAGRLPAAVAYAGGSVLLSIAALCLGLALARSLT